MHSAYLELFVLRMTMWFARLWGRWADWRTPALTDAEWTDIVNRFPKLRRFYERGILTEGETARLYRHKLAWEPVAGDR